MFMCQRQILKFFLVKVMSSQRKKTFLSPVSMPAKKEFRLSDLKLPSPAFLFSASDARSIGVTAPVRESGDIAASGACKLGGPKGEVEINEGVIVAKRHIHMTSADAAEFGLSDKQVVSVKIDSAERSLTFGDVVVRVNDSFALAMHIDTDEANAVLAGGNAMGEIIK